MNYLGNYNNAKHISSKDKLDNMLITFNNLNSSVNNHINNKSNPHGTTKSHIGLNNVDNTSDINKPVSTAQQIELDKKVDKISGKYLSTNDYTTNEKNKLAGIATGAQVNSITGIKGNSENTYRTGQVNLTPENIGAIPLSQKGIASGVAELDNNGFILSSQLPSYVDDVLNYKTKSDFPVTGESGKIYIDESTETTWRWSGTIYVQLTSSVALGETSSTAYRGDRGKIAFDHSQTTHARTDATLVAKSTTNGNILINGTQTVVYTHPSGTNPHGTTKSDVGLSNVPNVTTNNQTPTFSKYSTDVDIVSGETLSTILGKIQKSISTIRSNQNTYDNLIDSTTIKAAQDAGIVF